MIKLVLLLIVSEYFNNKNWRSYTLNQIFSKYIMAESNDSGSGEQGPQIQNANQICEVEPEHGDGDGQYRDPLEVWMDWNRLGPVQRLAKYAECEDSHTRLMSGRVLLEVLRGGGLTSKAQAGGSSCSYTDNTVEELEEIIIRLQNDSETCVRMELVEQISHAISACREQNGLLASLANGTLLNVIIAHLKDTEDVVRKTAQATLLRLMEQDLIPQNLLVEKICPAVLSLTDPNGGTVVKESLTSAIGIMAKMAVLLGREATTKFILSRFTELCSEEPFCVRKACASSFGDLCAIVGRQCFESTLIPSFVKLCSDDIWGVRKACADVSTVVSFFSSPSIRHDILSCSYVSLLEDDSRWVRMAAFQNLGPFISTFANPRITTVSYNVHRELIVTSLDMCDSDDGWRTHTQNTQLKILLEKCIRDADDADISKNNSSVSQAEGIKVHNDGDRKNSLCEAEENKGKIPIVVIEGAENFDHLEDCDKTSRNEENQLVENSNFYGNNFWFIPPPELDSLSLLNDSSNSSFVNNSQNDDRVFYELSSTQISICESENKETDLDQEIVPQALVLYFTSMVNPACGLQLDNESSYHCAYSFPAVALTLGRKHWPLLKGTYEILAGDMQWKVRKTVASSLHVIAEILGEEIASKDLCPIFEAFIKDLDEVRIGVLKHMAEFFKTITHSERSSFLPRLGAFRKTDNCCNWRFREELARQLLACVNDHDLFTPLQCYEYLVELSEELLKDKVASVRKIAAELTVALVSRSSENEQQLDESSESKEKGLSSAMLSRLFEEFASSSMWSRRQMYAYICGLLLKGSSLPPVQFENECLKSLLALSWDAVPNVRLALAKVLVEDVSINEYFSGDLCKTSNEIQIVLHQLCNDDDSDVRNQARLSSHDAPTDPRLEEALDATYECTNETITAELPNSTEVTATIDSDSSISDDTAHNNTTEMNNLDDNVETQDDDEKSQEFIKAPQSSEPIFNDFIKKFCNAIHITPEELTVNESQAQ
ncbi:serine/threonine-protein phosphatase 4 regulatory subunit 1-like isoform X2 [Ctenocephalides felis]|uniref:serine/threonine-protein phosphatase 4 regulatory subunit 1-like isoform X2 n=1 Tax=Ctenocephalides felis TaxID=7515 RepID=UPI000E6E34D3|nr:serine/threonine-protein phosphatase 4 regulatory subunit 1-like isoform X2 [Ctenocephalides felis]